MQVAPAADAMEVIGAKFKPKSDGSGGVEYVPDGYTTVDLNQLQQRFKDFNLQWPKVDIKKLQKFRNDIEHLHLNEPIAALKEAIASSFPMIVELFEIVGEDPKEHLDGAWDTILSEREAFKKVQDSCVASLEIVDWPAPVERLDQLSCPKCSSSLVGQFDPTNMEREKVIGRCRQCGEEIANTEMMCLVVDASYGYETFSIIKDGGTAPVATCPICGEDAYVESGEHSVFFCCGESISGECYRCGATIDVNEYDYEHEGLCSYCAYMADKVMNE